MSKNISEARAKRSVTATAASPAWRRAKTSPCSVATWTCSTGSSPAAVGDREQVGGVLAPALGLGRGGEHRAAGIEDRGAPQVGDISVRKASAASADSPARASVAAASGMWVKIPTVTLARASWIIVVVVCAIAAVLFAFSGYTGYAITLVPIGLAAAVNLLPPA